MKKYAFTGALLLTLASAPAMAGGSNVDAAIGGGLGGAIGAAIGNEIAGRDGAILGGAVGAAGGAAITTRDHDRYARYRDDYRDDYRYRDNRYARRHPGRGGNFCPPGQAKKGRCW